MFVKQQAAALVLAAVIASSACAEWPSLNPFSSTKKSSSQKSWLPSWKKPTATRSGPTTWQRVKSAPGQMVTKTKDTLAPLNPFKGETKKSIYAGPKDQDKDSTWFGGWGGEEKPEKARPNTVSDWLDNPRPE